MEADSQAADDTGYRQVKGEISLSRHYAALHHALMVPLMRLDERCLKDVAIDPDENDVCLIAADLCVSCYHFVERFRSEDSHLARRLQASPQWQILGDIANTRKHFKRHKASRQVRLEARLAYELSTLGCIGFIRTEVLAITASGKSHNVVDMLMRTIQHFREVLGVDGGSSLILPPPRPKHFHDKLISRVSYETLTMAKTSVQVYLREKDGSLVAAGEGMTFAFEVEMGVPDIVTIGRYQLTFDRDSILAWFDNS